MSSYSFLRRGVREPGGAVCPAAWLDSIQLSCGLARRHYTVTPPLGFRFHQLRIQNPIRSEVTTQAGADTVCLSLASLGPWGP